MSLSKLAPLNKGDTVAFISPSTRLNEVFPRKIDRARAFFENAGYKINIIYTKELSLDYVTSIKQRSEELHTAFRDQSIKAILCTIGGYSCNELLSHLDYNLIKENPKIFCGFSDITILHQALYTQADLLTFYGPAAIVNFADYPNPVQFTSDNFFGAVKGYTGQVPQSQGWSQEWLDWGDVKTDLTLRTLTFNTGWKWLRSGKTTGKLLGGCLPALARLIGSKYAVDYKDGILLIETPESDSSPDQPFRLDKARSIMTDLRNAGILSSIIGLVIGRPYMYNVDMKSKFETMILEQCYDTSFPILVDVDIGHTHPTLTLPLGCIVSLDSDKNGFKIEESPITHLAAS